MTTIPTPEEMVRRVKAALAEARYPDADVRECTPLLSGGWPNVMMILCEVPEAAWWQACWVAYEGRVACWACWPDNDANDDCLAGNCHHPEGPARPPRELLNGGRS